MSPLFTVIVPVFMTEKYLPECINSILKQNYSNFELILVDDGGTDNCPQICRYYASVDSRVKVIQETNQGALFARLNAALLAEGEYLVFVDADDKIREDTLSLLVEAIDNNNRPDIIMYQREGTKYINANSNILRTGYYNRQEIEETIIPYIIESVDCKFVSGSMCDKVVKRTLFSVFEIMNYGLKFGEDRACVVPLFLNASSVFVMADEVYFYRNHMDSAIHRKSPFPLDSPFLFAKAMEKLVNLAEYDLQEQLYRCVTHNVFVFCKSQFFSEDSYYRIKQIILETLDMPYYKKCINLCKYKGSVRGRFVHFVLKTKMIWIMYICCKLGL